MDGDDEGPGRLGRVRGAPAWRLIVVTVAIVGLFVASTVYSQHVAARLDAAADSIAGNASPSIVALSSARGEVLRAEVAVVRAIDAGPGGLAAARTAAEDALARLRDAEAEYLRLPFYPGERARWNEVAAAAHAFEDEVAINLAALESGRIAEARAGVTERLRPATERLDSGLGALVAFDADQQHRLGLAIPQLRTHAARMAYLLDAGSALLAILLIALVLRESRRRQRLLADFSERLEAIASSTVRINSMLARDGNERPMLDVIAQEAGRLVDADYVAVGVPGEVSAVPPGHPPMGPILDVPIRREGRRRGNLYLARRAGRPPFSGEDEHIIRLLATQAGVSTHNAELYRRIEEQRTRAELLADGSARMVGSLDYDTTIHKVAHAVVPAFADVCVVHVTDEAGEIVRMVMATGDLGWRSFFDELTARFGRPLPGHPAVLALCERRTLRFAVDGETLDRIAQSPEHRRMLAEIPMKHGLCVPMAGRARLLGVLSFFTFRDVPFADRDVAFAEELARRAALSIDNAILHEHTRRAVQARDDVLAIVSHDLRNPLTSIGMTAELLKRDSAADPGKRRELATRIRRTSDGMARLIADLLDASKIESGTFVVQPKPEHVDALLGEALEPYRAIAATSSIAIDVHVDPEVAEVVCDRDRILQVLSNLVGNALKFTPPGGTVTLSVEPLDEEVRFAVSDTGPGIAERDRQHVFDRYWQAAHTRQAGAGLGLFIVKGIVEAHGGRVWAEAGPGGGASLCFALPTSPVRRPSPEGPTREAPVH